MKAIKLAAYIACIIIMLKVRPIMVARLVAVSLRERVADE